jgi:hypothetical protein
MQIHPADGFFAANPINGNIHELVDFEEGPLSVEASAAAPRRPR